jgi:futalosine hydrolase
MRLLIAAATRKEIEPFIHYLQDHFVASGTHQFRQADLEVYICITGIGVMHTAFALSEAFIHFQPQYALQAGVAGAFDLSLPLGSLVAVKTEVLGDLGVEDGPDYRDIFEIGLIQPDEIPYSKQQLHNAFIPIALSADLPRVVGLTVNTVSGRETSIRSRLLKYKPDVESMEGAAFHYICLKKAIPFLQIRSISNHVTTRDPSKWRMEEAIKNLNQWMEHHIEGYINVSN